MFKTGKFYSLERLVSYDIVGLSIDQIHGLKDKLLGVQHVRKFEYYTSCRGSNIMFDMGETFAQ